MGTAIKDGQQPVAVIKHRDWLSNERTASEAQRAGYPHPPAPQPLEGAPPHAGIHCSLFAGHEETPGKHVTIDGKEYQEYYGSASEYQKGTHHNVEGKKILLPVKGKIGDTLKEMQEDLQSAVSYAGVFAAI